MSTSSARIGRRWWPVGRSTRCGVAKPSGSQDTPRRVPRVDTDVLLAWYERVRRPLPWRFTRDPYALLVSEVMLQQTQASRVVPHYEAFLRRFPDPPALAAARPAEVLALWSGLGYNRRALALKAAAGQVAAEGWPADPTPPPRVGPYH